MTEKLKVPENFEAIMDFLKARYNKWSRANDYDEKTNPVVGKLWWSKPDNVLWLYSTDNDEEGYEGNQTQFGVDTLGVVHWAYYSHCSCNSYSDYDGETKAYSPKTHTRKDYELENIPEDIKPILVKRLREVLKDFRKTLK